MKIVVHTSLLVAEHTVLWDSPHRVKDYNRSNLRTGLLKYINHLTTNDDYGCHQNSAACYQLAQSVLKIGSVLAERVGRGEVGGCHPEGDSACRLLQLAVEKPWSMPGGPLFCFLAQMGLENTPFAL